jgi:hypothetical protein
MLPWRAPDQTAEGRAERRFGPVTDVRLRTSRRFATRRAKKRNLIVERQSQRFRRCVERSISVVDRSLLQKEALNLALIATNRRVDA